MKNFLILSLLSVCSLISFAQVECDYQPDVESDYLIGVSDILAVLGLFGEVDLDQDGIWDSTSKCSNYCIAMRAYLIGVSNKRA